MGQDPKSLPKSVASHIINASKVKRVQKNVEFNENDNQNKSFTCLLTCSGTVCCEKGLLKQAFFTQL